MTWPWPGAACLQQSAHDAEGEHHAAAAEVGDQIEGRDRRLALAADGRQGSRQGQVVDVVAGEVGLRPALAPTGHAAVHQPGVAFEAWLGPDTEPLRHAGPEALDQRVGLRHQGQDRRHTVGMLEVDRDRTPAPVEQVL